MPINATKVVYSNIVCCLHAMSCMLMLRGKCNLKMASSIEAIGIMLEIGPDMISITAYV